MLHVNTSPTRVSIDSAGHAVPEFMNGYALEDGHENAGNGEANDKVVAPKEDAAELDDGEDAVLEEDATFPYWSDMIILDVVCIFEATEAVDGGTHTWSI